VEENFSRSKEEEESKKQIGRRKWGKELYHMKGRWIVWSRPLRQEVGYAFVGRGERQRGEAVPQVLCLLIPVLVAVGSQREWRRDAYPHSGRTAAGFGYQQSEYVAFWNHCTDTFLFHEMRMCVCMSFCHYTGHRDKYGWSEADNWGKLEARSTDSVVACQSKGWDRYRITNDRLIPPLHLSRRDRYPWDMLLWDLPLRYILLWSYKNLNYWLDWLVY
jgi:hypothetical protein